MVGLVAGVLAKWAMPGPDPGGVVITVLIGVAGAFLGAWILSLLGLSASTGSIGLGSILTATLGAIILLAVYRFITRRVV